MECVSSCRVRIAALPQRKEHWLTRRADSSRLSTQCSYLLCVVEWRTTSPLNANQFPATQHALRLRLLRMLYGLAGHNGNSTDALTWGSLAVTHRLPVHQYYFLLCATFRVAYGNDITGLFAAPVRDLLRQHARCYPLKRALSSSRLCEQERRSITMPSLVGAHY